VGGCGGGLRGCGGVWVKRAAWVCVGGGGQGGCVFLGGGLPVWQHAWQRVAVICGWGCGGAGGGRGRALASSCLCRKQAAESKQCIWWSPDAW
jgi:hypothetical protein